MNSGCLKTLTPSSSLLDAVSEHFGDKGIAPLRIEHRVIHVVVSPVQIKISLDERGAIYVDRVNVRYRLFLRYSSSDQPVDFRVARSVEEYPKHVLAIAQKVLRTPANDYAGSARQCVINDLLGYVGDSACIKQFQPIRGRQGALERSSEKRLEDAINCRIIFPFSLLDRLRRTVGEPRDFLSEFVIPQLPTQKLGQLGSDRRTATSKFTFDRYGLNHHDNP